MAEVVSGDRLQQTLAYAAEKLCLDRLNEIQEEAIAAFIDGKDVFVNLPTGYGKSAVFGSVPFVLDYIGGGTDKSIALIVEPTAAVMQEQVLALKAKGIPSVKNAVSLCLSDPVSPMLPGSFLPRAGKRK